MDEYIQRGTRQFYQAIFSIFLGSIAAMAAEYCVQPIIPILAQDFQLSPSIASLVMSSGTGGMAVAMLFVAALASKLDRKLTMSVALAVSAVLVVIMSMSTNFYVILVLRLFQGMILAAFPALMVAYICEEFNPDIIGLVTGAYISGNSFGGLLGRFMLSSLTDLFSWRIGLGAIGITCFVVAVFFFVGLPKSRYHHPHDIPSGRIGRTFFTTLANKQLITIYIIAFMAGGCFISLYNYIAFPLMAPPYSLSQTAIGALFAVYLVGTVSSPFLGSASDKYGKKKIISISIGIMLTGAILTLLPSLIAIIVGLAVFTLGYFGVMPIAASWAGKCCTTDKAQGSAFYYLFFYTGVSVLGTVGGVFLSAFDWPGVIMMITVLLGSAWLLSVRLSVGDERR